MECVLLCLAEFIQYYIWEICPCFLYSCRLSTFFAINFLLCEYTKNYKSILLMRGVRINSCWAIMNSTIMSIPVPIFWWSYVHVFSGFIPRRGIAVYRCCMWLVLVETAKQFSKVSVTSWYFPWQCTRVLAAPRLCQYLLFFSVYFNSSGGYVVIITLSPYCVCPTSINIHFCALVNFLSSLKLTRTNRTIVFPLQRLSFLYWYPHITSSTHPRGLFPVLSFCWTSARSRTINTWLVREE